MVQTWLVCIANKIGDNTK